MITIDTPRAWKKRIGDRKKEVGVTENYPLRAKRGSKIFVDNGLTGCSP